MKICMFVYNTFRHDSRVLRAASTFAANGHDVRLVAVLGEGLPRREERSGFHVIRIDHDPYPTKIARRLLKLRSRRASASGASQLAEVGGNRAADRDRLEAPGWRLAWGGLAARTLLRLHLSAAYWKYIRRAYAEARAEPADLYWANDLDTLPVAYLASRRLGGRLVYDSHELWVDRSYIPPQTRFGRWKWTSTESALIRRADHVVTVSELIAAELSGRHAVPKPSVIRNIPVRPSVKASIHDLRAKLELPVEKRLVLYVGLIAPNRGLEELMKSALELPDCVMVMLGSTENRGYFASLQREVEELGIEDRFRFAGTVPSEEVVSHARSADLGVVTFKNTGLSYYLTNQNKLFEYIAAGLPVVGSDFPGIRSIVDRYRVGVTCDPGDPRAVAAAIRSVLEDGERYAQFSRNSEQAAKELTWENESQKLLAIVNRLDA